MFKEFSEGSFIILPYHVYISSINRFQIRGFFPSGAVERIFCSITDIKMFVKFGAKEVQMAVPCVCRYGCPLKEK